jgi:hypothetical protein
VATAGHSDNNSNVKRHKMENHRSDLEDPPDSSSVNVAELMDMVRQQRAQMLRQEDLINRLREEIAQKDSADTGHSTQSSADHSNVSNTVSFHPRHQPSVLQHAGKRVRVSNAAGPQPSGSQPLAHGQRQRHVTSTPLKRSSSEPSRNVDNTGHVDGPHVGHGSNEDVPVADAGAPESELFFSKLRAW